MSGLLEKTLIFDVDGVIINSMHSHCSAWREAAMKQGFIIDSEQIYLREGEKGEVSAHYFLTQNNKEATPEAVRQLLHDKEVIFEEMAEQQIYPYVEEIFALLSDNRLPVALVTGSSFRELKRHLPKKIFEQCTVKITGDQVERGKPHPEPYQRALDDLGIRADDAVAIENAPYGIRSAKAAKIYCIALTTSLPAKHLSEADTILPSTKELFLLLKNDI